MSPTMQRRWTDRLSEMDRYDREEERLQREAFRDRECDVLIAAGEARADRLRNRIVTWASGLFVFAAWCFFVWKLLAPVIVWWMFKLGLLQ